MKLLLELFIKDGHHRAKAALQAGLKGVPINRLPVTNEASKKIIRDEAFDAKFN